MNQNESNQQFDQQAMIADLPMAMAEAEEIKGGPKKIFIGGLSVAPTAPQTAADNTAPQTREHILLARQVG